MWLSVLLCVGSSGSGAAGSLPLTSPTMGEGGGLFVQCGVHCVCMVDAGASVVCCVCVWGGLVSVLRVPLLRQPSLPGPPSPALLPMSNRIRGGEGSPVVVVCRMGDRFSVI